MSEAEESINELEDKMEIISEEQSKFKKKIVKRQRNTTQMKEQTRNKEVQINEEEIGKLPGK